MGGDVVNGADAIPPPLKIESDDDALRQVPVGGTFRRP